MRQIRLFVVSALLLPLAVAAPARANDSAGAQALFDDAAALIKDGKWAAACPKLEESQRLDPGTGTQYRLAKCYEQTGRLASAWANYLEVADASHLKNQLDRENVARAAAKALEPRLSHLEIDVAGARGPAFRITRDGTVVVGAGQWGSAIPVDSGSHSIEASEPGKKTWKTVAPIDGEAKSVVISVPVLEDDVHAVAPSPGADAANPSASAPSRADEPPPPASSSRHTLAVVVGAAGVVALGFGGYFGVTALSKKSDSNDGHCSGSVCDSTGVGLRSDAVRDGNVSSVLLGAGILAAGAGVVLWFTAPSSTATTVGFDGQRIVVRGAF